MAERILLLNGGGLDSISQLILLSRNYHVESLHIDYGQIAADKEWESVQYFSNKYGLACQQVKIDLGTRFESHPLFSKDAASRSEYVLDGRNMALISLAIMYSSGKFDTIAVGYHKEPDDVYLDATYGFLEKIKDAIEYLKLDVEVEAPYATFTREHTIEEAYNYDKEIFDKSWTAYKDVETDDDPHIIQKRELRNRIECAE